MRIALALALVAVSFGLAFSVHGRHTWTVTGVYAGQSSDNPFSAQTSRLVGSARAYHHPGWEDPVAALIAALGVVLAVTVTGRSSSVQRHPQAHP